MVNSFHEWVLSDGPFVHPASADQPADKSDAISSKGNVRQGRLVPGRCAVWELQHSAMGLVGQKTAAKKPP